MGLTDKLAHERRGRLAAERLLELKQAELFSANAKLGKHALELSDQIVEKREEAEQFRVEAEALKGENHQVRSDLRVAEQRLWNSVQTINDGFAVFSPSNRLITANDSFLNLFDRLEEVKSGVTYGRLLELMVEEGIVDVGSQPTSEWQAVMLERWQGEILKPLTVKLWDQRFVNLIDRRADNGETVTLAIDITESIEREEELKEARNRAESASQAKSSFLANMSHELRTPMNGVVGMAELLLESEVDDEQKLYIDTIKNSGEALLVIINDVLDYSKAEAGKLSLHAETFSLRDTITEIFTLLLPTAQDKGLALTLEYEDGLPRSFIADPGRVRQVLINLLGNAIKFTKSGGVTLRIAGIETSEDGVLLVLVEVEDTGIGIEADQIEHIFGEFNQAEDKHNRNFDGTGLGLAIVKQLVTMMGGHIWADSEVGKGSCFAFKVPLPIADDTPDKVLEDPDTEPEPEISPVKMRVLAAEDNKTNRLVFGKMVKNLDIDLQFAENGKEAVDLWESFRPDLVFMDISMPIMDGKEATVEIRKREDAAGLPPVRIVAATAHAMSGDDKEILASGIDHYLTKPLRKAQIVEQIVDNAPDDRLPPQPEQ